jgi:hypothetical protein
MERLKDALAEYIAALTAGRSDTTRPEDRKKYARYLAEAAVMFAALQRDGSLDKLRRLVKAERRAYEWSSLSGEEGLAAKQAFCKFARLVEEASLLPFPPSPQTEREHDLSARDQPQPGPEKD